MGYQYTLASLEYAVCLVHFILVSLKMSVIELVLLIRNGYFAPFLRHSKWARCFFYFYIASASCNYKYDFFLFYPRISPCFILNAIRNFLDICKEFVCSVCGFNLVIVKGNVNNMFIKVYLIINEMPKYTYYYCFTIIVSITRDLVLIWY